MTKIRYLAAALAVSALVMGGCASTSQLDEVRATAEAAKRTAAEAKATADRAAADAAEANRCCQDTNQKLDRVFKKSMYK
jgi:murein lipoprotein